MTNGIYILANDVVYDQMIALIHSVEKNVGASWPICVVPYDDNTGKIQASHTALSAGAMV